VKKKNLIFTTSAMILLMVLMSAVTGRAASVTIPGSKKHAEHYITYAYSMPGEDLLFHLNETVLFDYMPTYADVEEVIGRGINSPIVMGKLRTVILRELTRSTKMTFTYRFRNILRSHRELLQYLEEVNGNPTDPLNVDVSTREGFRSASRLFKRLGLALRKEADNSYRLLELVKSPRFNVNQLYKLMGINTWRLQKQLTVTQKFQFQLKECQFRIPWEMDFLQTITGLPLDSKNFVRFLFNNPKLNRLVALLYRLSDVEIDFIGKLEPGLGAWKEIYSSEELLTGMFLLSHALRIRNGRILLPGGIAAAGFWQEQAGAHPVEQPWPFIRSLALKDSGKLNWFYIFGFFLPETLQEVAFCNFEGQKFQQVYHLLRLARGEKLSRLRLPALQDFSLFSFFYCLQTRDGNILFPGGIDAWAKTVGAKENSLFAIVKRLLDIRKGKEGLKRFISIYSKFFDRPQLLTEQAVLDTLYRKYTDYNVLIDFIERLPLQRPETVLKLFRWAKSFDRLRGPGKEESIAVFQSLLALLSNGAEFNPGPNNYDRLLEKLMQIPLEGADAYDGIFRFLENVCDVDLDPDRAERSFADFMLGNAGDPEITILNQSYVLEAANLLRFINKEIREKQESCSFSQLTRINGLLREFVISPGGHRDIFDQLNDALDVLPRPEDNGETLIRKARELIAKKTKKASKKQILKVIRSMKAGGLLNELKNFLVTCVYGIHAKNSGMRVFINPNLVRLHDFALSYKKNAWNCSNISLGEERETVYHVEGGLSRMMVLLAEPYAEYLFRRRIGGDTEQIAPLIYNNLDLFPYPHLGKAQTLAGLLVKLGSELLKEANKDPELAKALKDEAAFVTAGYHYRKLMERLNGKNESFQPTFRELLQLGERAFLINQEEKEEERQEKGIGRFLSRFSRRAELEAFRSPQAYRTAREQLNRLGSVYYYTFGKLKPHYYHLFPQSLSHLLESKWTGGEMNNEFKIKAAYISWLKGMPPQLLGHLVFRYLYYITGYFSQYYDNDYHKTNFVYNTYNFLFMNRLYKEFKQKGILRVK
jgi:hypothetical protein